jgi:hypothetical protein
VKLTLAGGAGVGMRGLGGAMLDEVSGQLLPRERMSEKGSREFLSSAVEESSEIENSWAQVHA